MLRYCFQRLPLFLTVILMTSFISTTSANGAPLKYPKTRRVEQTDNFHGTLVADPYRWLENDVRESKEVANWVTAQNKVTFEYLKKIPQRQAINKRLTELWNYERYGSPTKHGHYYYYFKNNGLQNQSVLYRSKTVVGKSTVVLDPNKWSKNGTVALSETSFSNDGKYLAYSVTKSGSDWHVWSVMETATRKKLTDHLEWVKFSDVAWTRDNKGFFYTRYDEPKKGTAFQSVNLNEKLMYHRIGTPQKNDVLVYHRPDQPKWGYGLDVTEDGRYLIITVAVGTDDRYRIFYKDLDEPYGMPIELIDNFNNEFSFIGNDGATLYFKTDYLTTKTKSPRKRIIAIDLQRPQKRFWKEIVPQAKETLTSANIVNNLFVVRYLKDARTQIKLFSQDGKFVRDVTFQGIGSASGFDGRPSDTETFYSFSSYTTPSTIFRYDMITGKSEPIRQPNVKFSPNDYTVKQIFYKSKDGTRVPMFLAHKEGLKLNGKNPTLLYGYGGFNISLTPRFSIGRLAWMEMGGVIAVANLRGGGEYGEEWHQAGTKLNKQNVFDDFIAAGEWLIKNRYTTNKKLAIQGRSNGGLLVGAVLAQRPDLFGACLPGVGVMDMLRFHKFTAGRYWVDDYGSADNPKEFKALYAYSPYHNLKPNVAYPPTLVTTADTDDRVVPGHSFKFAAQLQASHTGNAPVFIRIETEAGHGAGIPTSKQIAAIADEWAFLVKTLQMTIPVRKK